MIGALAVAAQILITVSAPDTVNVRDLVPVTVQLSAPSGSGARIVAPSFAPFRVVRRSTVSSVDMGGASRAARETSEHRFVLAATQPGTFTIPPFIVRAGSVSTPSRALRLVVRDVAPPTVAPAIVNEARIDVAKGVNFHALVTPETVYVGQQATYQVGVFLDDDVRLRLRRNPEFVPPELRAMLAYELGTSRGPIPTRVVGGRRYEVHVFQRAIFPLSSGRFVIPPAQLLYALPLSASFFAREENYTALAESLSVVALPPPAAGRPADFAGAVGELQLSARVDSASGRVGDPLLLTVRVSGSGNVKLFPRPALTVPWASAVPGRERVRVDNSGPLVQGTKEFDWILTPRAPGAQRTPPVRYPFFNPRTERYEVAVTEPLDVQVAPGALATLDSARGAPPLPVRRTYRGPVAPELPAHQAFWLVLLAAPLPALAFGVGARPRRARPPVAPARRLRDLTRSPQPADAALLRRAYAAAVADRLGLAPAVLTRRGGLARALRRAGTTPELAADAEALLAALDLAAYSGAGAAPAGTAARAYELFCRVDSEARSRAALGATAAATGAMLLVALGGATLWAAERAAADAPAAQFARGIAAYQARRFTEAAAEFDSLARRVPRAADAWANAGTAAYLAGDTVRAVVGWQRAERLEPGARDVREYLALLPVKYDGSVSAVPPVSVSLVAGVAGVLWVAAWGVGAFTVRRRRALGGWAAAGLVASLALGWAALAQHDRLVARDFAVVTGDVPLRASPALGAEASGTAVAGEVARAVERRSVWSRVRLDDSREGWVESDRLIGIARE